MQWTDCLLTALWPLSDCFYSTGQARLVGPISSTQNRRSGLLPEAQEAFSLGCSSNHLVKIKAIRICQVTVPYETNYGNVIGEVLFPVLHGHSWEPSSSH